MNTYPLLILGLVILALVVGFTAAHNINIVRRTADANTGSIITVAKRYTATVAADGTLSNVTDTLGLGLGAGVVTSTNLYTFTATNAALDLTKAVITLTPLGGSATVIKTVQLVSTAATNFAVATFNETLATPPVATAAAASFYVRITY